MIDKLLKRIDDTYVLRLLTEMVGIPSVTGDEKELAEFLSRELAELDFKTDFQEVEDGRKNIYGIHKFDEEGPMLMFNGHMDTVPVCDGWQTDPFNPVRKGGKLYGLGSCDMKGGLASMLTALKALIDTSYPLKGTIAFSGVIDEEAYSKGAKALLETELAKSDAVIVGEPDFGDEERPLPLGMTGKVLYEIIIKGRSAHGFHPERGVNAIEEAAKILTSLNRLKQIDHPRFGKGSLCILKIEGGYKRYSIVVPDKCTLIVNRLTVPGESVKSAVSDLEELIKNLDLKADVEVKTPPPLYEPFEMSMEEPIIRAFREAYKEILGRDPIFTYQATIGDANEFVGSGGIPTVNFGPKGKGLHEADEYVEVDTLITAAKVYVLTAAKFLNTELTE